MVRIVIILSYEALKCEAMAFTHEKRVQVPSQLHNKNNYKVHRFKPFTRFKDPVNEKSLMDDVGSENYSGK